MRRLSLKCLRTGLCLLVAILSTASMLLTARMDSMQQEALRAAAEGLWKTGHTSPNASNIVSARDLDLELMQL